MKKVKIEDNANFIEIYILVSGLKDLAKKKRFDEFFDKTLEDVSSIQVSPRVFLTLHSATHYNRFLGNDYAVLKAFVPEMAIEGHGNELILKDGYIHKSHVHSCIPNWVKSQKAFDNPYFSMLS